MSYILDALKKLEQKRERDEMPRLLTFSLDGEEARKRRLVWPYIVTAVLFLNALVMIWWINGREAEKGPAAVDHAAGLVKETGQSAPARPAVAAGAGPSAAHGVTAGDAAPTIPHPAAGQPEAREAQGAAQPGAAQTVGPAGKEALTEGAARGGAAAVTRPAQPGTPSLSRPRAAESESPPARPDGREKNRKASGRVLEIGELPPAVRGAVPEFRISGHAYSPDPQTRVVRINEKILQEGQELAPGLLLNEIVPGGAIFTFQGYLFRVRLNTGR
jgi:general secretion pathway protein B